MEKTQYFPQQRYTFKMCDAPMSDTENSKFKECKG